MKAQEKGRSMIEMLGVLAVIGILTLAGFFGYQKAILKARVNKTTETIVLALQRYADITLKDTAGLNITGETALIDALAIGLIDNCEMLESEAEANYQICEVPLGELYVKLESKDDNMHSYMLMLMMMDQDENVCTSFLTQGWNEAFPKEWWKNAMIWLKSDKGVLPVYSEGGARITQGMIGNACKRMCSKDSPHCMVVFDIGNVNGG